MRTGKQNESFVRRSTRKGSHWGGGLFVALMKMLEAQIKKDGWDNELMFRDGMIAVYHKSKFGVTKLIEHYEVIRIQSHNGYILAGVEYPPSEFYPSSEQWGVHGFTCMDYTAALAKAYEMVAADKAKAEAK